VRYDCSRRVHHIWADSRQWSHLLSQRTHSLIKTNEGRIVASNIPKRMRQMIRPVKLVAAAEAVSDIILGPFSFLTYQCKWSRCSRQSN
jgi:hypothetical protein